MLPTPLSKMLVYALAAVAVAGAATNGAHAAWPSGDHRMLRRVIVKFKDNADPGWARPSGRERAASLNQADHPHASRRHGMQLSYLKSITPQSHVLLSSVAMSRSDMADLTRDLAQDPRVEYAEIDERVYPLSFTPNDPGYASDQWNLKAPADAVGGANLPGAWNQTVPGNPASLVNGAGVTVAILDTGYRPHNDLLANLVTPGYDFVSADDNGSFTTANDGDGRDADALDPGDWNAADPACALANSTWHGTRVAGILGAVSNNTGIIGVAYGASLLPVRVLGHCGGYISDIAAAIQWAAGLAVPGVPTNTHIAKVINLSIGSVQACPATFQNAITAARNAGSVVVAAAGNGPSSSLSSPANCNGVIAVTAHTRLGDNADYANTGTGTHISAPGGGDGKNHLTGDGGWVYSTANTGPQTPISDTYVGGSGTSFAAPHVSGVAALLFQIRPTISPEAVLHYLSSTARAYPAGTYCNARSDCGAGMLDASAAVQALITAQAASNHPPVMVALAAQTVAAGSSLQFTASATDADGDRIRFTLSGLPYGASFDGDSGVFQWTYALPGTYTVTITPSDGLTTGPPLSVQIRATGALPSGGGAGSATWVDVLAALMLWLVCRRLRHAAAPA